jgi:hypothetical protein
MLLRIRPGTVLLVDITALFLKILFSEFQLYVCGNFPLATITNQTATFSAGNS